MKLQLLKQSALAEKIDTKDNRQSGKFRQTVYNSAIRKEPTKNGQICTDTSPEKING